MSPFSPPPLFLHPQQLPVRTTVKCQAVVVRRREAARLPISACLPATAAVCIGRSSCGHDCLEDFVHKETSFPFSYYIFTYTLPFRSDFCKRIITSKNCGTTLAAISFKSTIWYSIIEFLGKGGMYSKLIYLADDDKNIRDLIAGF
jgi:hypothetical protein